MHSQVWVRRSAADPWVIDLPITPDRDGACGPASATPTTSPRPKDDRDLAVTWPLLDAEQQVWPREAVRRSYPGHAWVERMA